MTSVLHEIFSRSEICVLVCVAVVAITWLLVWGFVESRRLFYEANLKQSMVDRGMPAEEIERILFASSETKPRKNPTSSTPSKAPLSAKDLG